MNDENSYLSNTYLILMPMDFRMACVSASVLLISNEKISEPLIQENAWKSIFSCNIVLVIIIYLLQKVMLIYNQQVWHPMCWGGALQTYMRHTNFMHFCTSADLIPRAFSTSQIFPIFPRLFKVGSYFNKFYLNIESSLPAVA